LTVGRIIRFYVDGTVRGAGVVADDDVVVVSPDEEAGEVTTHKGGGLAAIFAKVKVRPDAGMSNKPFHPTRWFNFAADRLRDDDPAGPQGVWPFAVGQLPNYDTDNYFGRPEGFTDTAGPAGTGPQWLWNADTRTAFSAAGDVYFRQRFTLASDTDMLFEFAADDEGELWVDGVPICKTEGVYLGSCVKAGTRLTSGEHLIAVKGTNLNALRAGVVYAGWSVTDGMPDTLLVRSDATLARCLAYPADEPGFTAGEVPRLVVDEVQSLANPRLPDVTFSFISASDTDSAAFSEVVDITCHAPGDSILTLFEMLGETYLDWGMTPGTPLDPQAPQTTGTIEMNAWIRGTRGSDLSATVVFEKGNCRRVTHQRTGSDRATIALVTGDGYSFVVAHPDATTDGVYEEVNLDFGGASQASAAKYAMDYLDIVSQSREGVSIELVPDVGPVPYEDFGIGDTISIPGRDGTAEDHRVTAIGFEVGPDSVTRWTIDLDQPRLIDEERLSSIMRRQLPGAVGGRTLLPVTSEPSFLSNQAGTEEVHTWQFDGTAGDIVLKKNGTAVTGATITSPAAGATSKKTLTDAARKVTKGSDKLTMVVGSGDPSPEWIPPKGRWIQEFRAVRDATQDTTVVTVMVA
jgi:hypothetical protein